MIGYLIPYGNHVQPHPILVVVRNCSMIIREAEQQDAPVIAELLRQLGYEVGQTELNRRLASIAGRDGCVIVAVEETDGVVGCMHLLESCLLAEGRRAEIAALVVSEAVRGQGVGTRLLEAAADWAKTRGLPKIRVRANSIRTRSHHFYRVRGYQEIKTQKVLERDLTTA